MREKMSNIERKIPWRTESEREREREFPRMSERKREGVTFRKRDAGTRE